MIFLTTTPIGRTRRSAARLRTPRSHGGIPRARRRPPTPRPATAACRDPDRAVPCLDGILEDNISSELEVGLSESIRGGPCRRWIG